MTAPKVMSSRIDLFTVMGCGLHWLCPEVKCLTLHELGYVLLDKLYCFFKTVIY